MAELPSIQMVDILPLESVAEPSSVVFPLAVGFFAILLLIIWQRFYFQPLRKFKRQLNQTGCSTRQAAHNLSRIVSLQGANLEQLHQLRFARIAPKAQQLVDLVKQIEASSDAAII